MTDCKLCNLPTAEGAMQCTCRLTQRERTLPVWAQKELNDVRHRLALEADRRRQLASAHHLLKNREWFTLHGPREQDTKPVRYLYWDIGNPACSLGTGDVLLVGRAILRETL